MAEQAVPPLSEGIMAATVAISLLDKAFSYLGGGMEVDKHFMLSELRRIQSVLQEILSRMIKREALPTVHHSERTSEAISVSRDAVDKFEEDIWVFRDAVDEIEDAIDEIDYHSLEEEVSRNPISKFVKAKISNNMFARVVVPNRSLTRLRNAVANFDKRLWRAGGNFTNFAFINEFELSLTSDTHSARDDERYPSWMSTGEVFGRGREKEQIVQWLINHPAEGPEIVSADHISIFAVVGMVGMGKTTLARLVHKDPRVSINFDFVAFVPVSIDFIAKDILAAILESTGVSPEYYTPQFLQRTLMDKKLLLILDDVWEDNSLEKWALLMSTLRASKSGSRILLTTRMQSVADRAAAAIGGAADYLKLDDLDEYDNLMLFKSRLPSHIDSADYADLLLIGEQIANKIGGCPLVTTIVASWLGSHMETHHWKTVLQKGWQSIPLKYIIVASFMLSYDHLPAQLQICFKYCSIFPKGYRFNKLELANMWICSGFVPFSSSKQDDIGLQKTKDVDFVSRKAKGVDLLSAEDVGEQYFMALARKSFFCRMLESEPSTGHQKEYYVLHSLMHGLAQLVSLGEYARVDDGDFTNVKNETRHLYFAHCRDLRLNPNIWRLRTLIIQNESCFDPETELVLGDVLQNLKCLRLLYLDVPSLSHALDKVSSVIHLRYLFLFSCDESHLHKVFKLHHLQVFKLNHLTAKEAYFNGIQKLCCLRCLHVPDNMSSKIHQIGRLTSLHELHGFNVLENDGHRLSALSNLTNLHQLSLRNLQNVRNCNEATEVKLKDKQDMRFLSLSWNKYSNDPDYQIIDGLEPNKEIQQLHIHGYNGGPLPRWIKNAFLTHLVSLELEYCMKWKTLPSFQELNSLKYLKLEHLFQLEYIGTVLGEQFGTNEREDASLPPFLNTLIVQWCPNLKELPAIPCTLEQLIIKHVGLAVLPRIHQKHTGRCASASASSVKSDLAFLHVESCAHLTSLDEGLLKQEEDLQSLTTLVVRHCEMLHHLPTKGFTELHHLSFLEIVACPMLRDAKTEGSLLPMLLTNLDLNPCGDIEVSILMSLQNLMFLKRLTLFSCSNVKKLPSEEVFVTLNNLQDVSICRCKNLLSLGGLGAAASLRVLSILCCDKLHFSYSPQASCSFKLRKLKIDREAMLLAEPLRSLRHTNEIHICDGYTMESLPEEWLLQNGASLRSIEIGVAESLRSLPSQMAKLESLLSLHIESAPLIQSLPQLPASLSKLTIWGCDPMFLKHYEKDAGPDWGRIAHIDVDMKPYSEGMNYSDYQIQDFDNRQFVVID